MCLGCVRSCCRSFKKTAHLSLLFITIVTVVYLHAHFSTETEIKSPSHTTAQPTSFRTSKPVTQMLKTIKNITIQDDSGSGQSCDFVFGNLNNLCGHQKNTLTVLVLVWSSSKNLPQRLAIRETWARELTLSDGGVVFVIKKPIDKELQSKVYIEAAEFGDILEVNTQDIWNNDVGQISCTMRWIKDNCANAEYILKVEDDALVLPNNVRNFLQTAPSAGYSGGKLSINTQPIRDARKQWYISEQEWRFPTYPPYLQKAAYILSIDVIVRSVDVLSKINFTKFEDVYVGLILKELDVVATHVAAIDVEGKKKKHCDIRDVLVSRPFDASLLKKYWSGLRTLSTFPCSENISDEELLNKSNVTFSNEKNFINDLSMKFLINPTHLCTGDNNPSTFGETPFLIMITPSTIKGFEARQAIRKTRGNMKELHGNRIVSSFLIGMRKNDPSFTQIAGESNKFKDIIVVDMVDTYDNLTLKSVLLYKWAAFYCVAADYIMKVDDDVYVNIHNLVGTLVNAPRTRHVFCHVHENTYPIRITDKKNFLSRWYVSKEEWPDKPFPPYPSGPAYVMSYDVVRDMYLSARTTKFFRMEDVNAGINMQNIGVKPVHNSGFDQAGKMKQPCQLKHTVFATHYVKAQQMYTFWKDELDDFPRCGDL